MGSLCSTDGTIPVQLEDAAHPPLLGHLPEEGGALPPSPGDGTRDCAPGPQGGHVSCDLLQSHMVKLLVVTNDPVVWSDHGLRAIFLHRRQAHPGYPDIKEIS